MKILGISGGSKNGGNDSMCKEALMAAKAQGAEVEFINLQLLEIKHCTGCTACVQSLFSGKGGKCILKDDFDWMLDKMLDADGIVFCTPIFEKGATGLFRTITDRFGPRTDRGNNMIGTKIAKENGGTPPDPRLLNDKVISFMGIGGSDWVSRVQCDCGMLALTPGWKIIDNEVFPWSLSIATDDTKLARAHQIGENIVEAVKDSENASYQGDAGICAHCHSRNFFLENGTATCCLCGIQGEIVNTDGSYHFAFDPAQIEMAHDTLSGKFKHGDDINENTAKRIAMLKSDKFKERVKLCRAFIEPSVPQKA